MNLVTLQTEDSLVVTAERAWGWMVALEAQFTDEDKRRQATAIDFWAKHPDSMFKAANWCSPWDCTFNLWFHARAFWQYCIESNAPLRARPEIVRAIEGRISGKYRIVPMGDVRDWERVLELTALEALDDEIARPLYDLHDELRRAIEIIPFNDSLVVIGPGDRDSVDDLIGEVREEVAALRLYDVQTENEMRAICREVSK